MKTSLLLLLVSVLLLNISRAEETTYRRIVSEHNDPIAGIVLTKDWSPFRLTEKNVAAVLDQRAGDYNGMSFRQGFSEQLYNISNGVSQLTVDPIGKIQLSYRLPRTARYRPVYLRVVEVNKSLVLEYDPDINRASQFHVYQADRDLRSALG